MHDQLQARLEELKGEFATGRDRLQELERQQLLLRETMLRISGAIQVLEELLAEGGSAEQNGSHSGENQPLAGQEDAGNIIDSALQTPDLEDMTMDQNQTAQW
jgi:hypothetical protein